MIYFGIDPGSSSGAIAGIGPQGGAAKNFPRTDAELFTVLEETFDRYKYDVAVILERILMTPKTRQWKGTQKLVGNCHFIRGVLTAFHVPFESLTPRQWQAEVGCPGGGKDPKVHKDELFQRARDLFPNDKVTKRNADSFLLAWLARRRFGGESS
jgi:hypothetical protein